MGGDTKENDPQNIERDTNESEDAMKSPPLKKRKLRADATSTPSIDTPIEHSVVETDVPGFDKLTVEELVSIIGQYILENPQLSKKRAAKWLKADYKVDLKVSAIKKDERFKKALEIIKQNHSQ